MREANPFVTEIPHPHGEGVLRAEARTAGERLATVDFLTEAQLQEALAIKGLQKSVRARILARLEELGERKQADD